MIQYNEIELNPHIQEHILNGIKKMATKILSESIDEIKDKIAKRKSGVNFEEII